MSTLRGAPWRARLELTLTRLAVAGAADVEAPLLRLPYSSINADLDDGAWRAIQGPANRGTHGAQHARQ